MSIMLSDVMQTFNFTKRGMVLHHGLLHNRIQIITLQARWSDQYRHGWEA